MLWISSTTPRGPPEQIGKGSALASHHLQSQQQLGQARNPRVHSSVPWGGLEPTGTQQGLVWALHPLWRFSTTTTGKRTCNNTGTHATNRVRIIQPLLQCHGVISAASLSPQKNWHHPSDRLLSLRTPQHLTQYQPARDLRPICLHQCNYSDRARRATVNSTQLRALSLIHIYAADD